MTAAFVKKRRLGKHKQFENEGKERAVAFWQFVFFYSQPWRHGLRVIQYPVRGRELPLVARLLRFAEGNQ